MGIVYVGIDLAKNVLAVHGVDEHGKPALVRPAVPRAKLAFGTSARWRGLDVSAQPAKNLIAKDAKLLVDRVYEALAQRLNSWREVDLSDLPGH